MIDKKIPVWVVNASFASIVIFAMGFGVLNCVSVGTVGSSQVRTATAFLAIPVGFVAIAAGICLLGSARKAGSLWGALIGLLGVGFLAMMPESFFLSPKFKQETARGNNGVSQRIQIERASAAINDAGVIVESLLGMGSDPIIAFDEPAKPGDDDRTTGSDRFKAKAEMAIQRGKDLTNHLDTLIVKLGQLETAPESIGAISTLINEVGVEAKPIFQFRNSIGRIESGENFGLVHISETVADDLNAEWSQVRQSAVGKIGRIGQHFEKASRISGLATSSEDSTHALRLLIPTTTTTTNATFESYMHDLARVASRLRETRLFTSKNPNEVYGLNEFLNDGDAEPSASKQLKELQNYATFDGNEDLGIYQRKGSNAKYLKSLRRDFESRNLTRDLREILTSTPGGIVPAIESVMEDSRRSVAKELLKAEKAQNVQIANVLGLFFYDAKENRYLTDLDAGEKINGIKYNDASTLSTEVRRLALTAKFCRELEKEFLDKLKASLVELSKLEEGDLSPKSGIDPARLRLAKSESLKMASVIEQVKKQIRQITKCEVNATHLVEPAKFENTLLEALWLEVKAAAYDLAKLDEDFYCWRMPYDTHGLIRMDPPPAGAKLMQLSAMVEREKRLNAIKSQPSLEVMEALRNRDVKKAGSIVAKTIRKVFDETIDNRIKDAEEPDGSELKTRYLERRATLLKVKVKLNTKNSSLVGNWQTKLRKTDLGSDWTWGDLLSNPPTETIYNGDKHVKLVDEYVELLKKLKDNAASEEEKEELIALDFLFYASTAGLPGLADLFNTDSKALNGVTAIEKKSYQLSIEDFLKAAKIYGELSGIKFLDQNNVNHDGEGSVRQN